MAAHESVKMSVEQGLIERLREGFRCGDSRIDPLELDEVAFNPLLD
jgi:hypothetical protein